MTNNNQRKEGGEWLYVYVCVFIYVCVYVYVYICVYLCMYVWMIVCMCVFVYVCVCVCCIFALGCISVSHEMLIIDNLPKK